MTPASFLEDGHVVEVAGKDLMDSAKPITVSDDGRYDFVRFGTGSSIPFREHYNIPAALTIIRGTLRHKENPIMITTLMRVGWLDASVKDWLGPQVNLTWAQVTQRLLGADDSDENTLISHVRKVSRFHSDEQAEQVIRGLRWIGIFSSDNVQVETPVLVDILSKQLETLCSWNRGERDLLFFQHRLSVQFADGKNQTRTSTFELFGDPNGYSAMARSTGITCGIAAQLMLEKHDAVAKPGVLRPYAPDLCSLMQTRLEQECLKPVEKIIDD